MSTKLGGVKLYIQFDLDFMNYEGKMAFSS